MPEVQLQASFDASGVTGVRLMDGAVEIETV